MGKARGVSKRRKKAGSFHYKRSNKLKRQRLKELRKGGSINCDAVRQSWDPKKSLIKNMKTMGLAEDPNKLLSDVKFYEKFKNPALNNDRNESIVQRLHRKLERNHQKTLKKKMKKSNEFAVENVAEKSTTTTTKTTSVAEKLAEIASQPATKNFRFSPDQIKFCAYMIEKYGEDYDAMCRDKRNYYQESAGQIRSKIRKFLSIPSHRNVYEMAKKICETQID
uniref:Nucleolar protein 16 n=1 Tax=Dermatophagoides pteronyssinus TaxID=6956 RepID=A0A6P6YFD1_DERPT|nr:nucleolar protein 16-like [Dermatophagoides pteronyssinus]